MTEQDILAWDDWLDLELGEPDWLVPGLLERGGAGIVHGSSRSFKSFFMLQLCLDLAAGYPALGVFPVVPPKRTLMFQAEGTKRAWRQRMWALRDVYPTGIHFWSRHTSVEKFDSPAGDARMRAALALVKPDMVVLDPIAEFLSGIDTDAVSIQRWTAVMNGWREDFGCAVLLVHHDRQPMRFFNKTGMTTLDAGMEEARGNTRLPAWADLVVGMRRKDDVTTARVQKVRDAPDGQEFQFKFSGGRLVLASRSDALEQLALSVLVGKMWLSDVVKAVSEHGMGVHDRTIRRAIDRLVERGEVAQAIVGGRFQLQLSGEATT